MSLSTVKWAQWDKTQSRDLLVCSYVCALHSAQLLHTILHRTDLIIFPLTLQTIATSPMMSIWGKEGEFLDRFARACWVLLFCYTVFLLLTKFLRNMSHLFMIVLPNDYLTIAKSWSVYRKLSYLRKFRKPGPSSRTFHWFMRLMSRIHFQKHSLYRMTREPT